MLDQEPWDSSVIEARQSVCLHAGRASKSQQEHRTSHLLLAGALQQLKNSATTLCGATSKSLRIEEIVLSTILNLSDNQATINEEQEKNGVHDCKHELTCLPMSSALGLVPSCCIRKAAFSCTTSAEKGK